MKKLKLPLLLAGAVLAFTCAANAAILSGTLTLTNSAGNADSGPSSLDFGPTNLVIAASGDFSGNVPLNSAVESTSDGLFTGLSTSPQGDSVSNFFVISFPYTVPGTALTFPGTTPGGRFDFNLASIAEDSYNSTTGAAVYSGTGSLVDTTGAFSSSAADFTVDFSNTNDYTLTIVTVPEPATISLAAAGLLGALLLRRRKA